MKGLLSTGASRAWLGVAVAGAVVIAAVVALQLIPRLTAGQEILDAAKPAIGAGAVKGEVAATKLTSQYVDLADPLVTVKGDGAAEADSLIALIARRTGVSNERARAFLRREAPHTEALLRALPFSGIANERQKLTQFLSSTLITNPEALQDQLARDYPRLFQTLAELPAVTGGWYDVPGIEGLQLFDGTPVRTLPGFRRYLRDDLVATVGDEQERLRSLAGSGGIGYIPYLLLIAGLVALGFGLLHARWARSHPSGKIAWGFVAAIGVMLMLLVGALQYFPRLNGAQTTISKLEPAFDQRQVAATRAGVDLVVQAVRFGDPIMTKAGGAAAEVPRLQSFVAEQTGQSRNDVRSKLARATPRTSALLEAMPLSTVAAEVPKLLPVLARKLGMSEDKLLSTLRERTPKLAQALLSAGPVTAGWNALPSSVDLTRLDGLTPVRTMPEFAEYLDQDIVPLLETQREHFAELADTWPPVDLLPSIVLAIGVLLTIYGIGMMFLVTTPPARR
jgi:hypothetical protein